MKNVSGPFDKILTLHFIFLIQPNKIRWYHKSLFSYSCGECMQKSCHRLAPLAKLTFYSFFISHFFPSIPLLSMAHSAPLASAGTSNWLSCFYQGWGFPCHKYSLPVLRYTEYVIVNGEQQSCVDLQTLDCWLC